MPDPLKDTAATAGAVVEPVAARTGSAAALCGALLWRLAREGTRYLLSALLPYVVVLALTVTLPSLLGGHINGADRSTRFAVALGARGHQVVMGEMLLLAPALTALFGSIAATRMVQGLVGAEVNRGGFEELLSTPYPPGRIAAALLGCTLVVGTGFWAAMSALGALGVWITDMVTDSGVHPSGAYYALALVLPLLTTWAGGVLALAVSLFFPQLTQLGGGVNLAGGSLGNGVAVLPGLGALLALVLGADSLGPLRLLLIAGGAVAVITAGALTAVAAGFRPETVLHS
ncbi:hypothetical protein GCM10010129_24510 [Streptomyces fumigatiscleroticus]|nr:hypothetical protein GCM10010129_24510 [Streptomyces fumigatiscleroticus]